MKYNPGIHHRRSIRLKGYDYSFPGAYFITINTQDRARLYGEVRKGVMYLNDAGRMAADFWNAIPEWFPTVVLDEFIVMPDHLHGILVLTGAGGGAATTGATTRVAPTVPRGVRATLVVALTPRVAVPKIGAVVGAYKSLTTVEYIRGVRTKGWPVFRGRVWHRNYHEHIIRDECALDRIRQYIRNNPKQWERDHGNPEGPPGQNCH